MITAQIGLAFTALQNHQLVAIPTETVYGLAARMQDLDAIEKIYRLKGRPRSNPLIVHIASMTELNDVVENIPDIALRLAEKFWPGPLTLILPKKKSVPDLVTAGQDSVAVRVPDHSMTISLLHMLGEPLVAPSANPFERISPTTAGQVYSYFGENISFILDGGPCTRGLESTIVGFHDSCPVIYRKGAISKEQILQVAGMVKYRDEQDFALHRAPGSMKRHYSPKTPTMISDDALAAARNFRHLKTGVLLFRNQPLKKPALFHEYLTTSGDLNEAGKNLYSALQRLDRLGLDLIILEKVPEQGLGATINDRLERAAAGNEWKKKETSALTTTTN